MATVIRARQLKRLAQNERGRTHGPGVVAPLLHLHLDLLAEPGEREVPDRSHDEIEEGRPELRSLTADDDQLGVKQRDDVGDREAEPLAAVGKDLHGRGLALGGQQDELIPADVATMKRAHAPQQRPLADQRFQAAGAAALALRPVWIDDDVPELTSAPDGAAVHTPVDHDAETEAAANAQRDEVPRGNAVSGPLLGNGERIDVVVDPDRQPQPALERGGQLDLMPLKQVRELARAAQRVDHARQSDPDAEHLGPGDAGAAQHPARRPLDFGDRGGRIAHQRHQLFVRRHHPCVQVADDRRQAIAAQLDADDVTGLGVELE